MSLPSQFVLNFFGLHLPQLIWRDNASQNQDCALTTPEKYSFISIANRRPKKGLHFKLKVPIKSLLSIRKKSNFEVGKKVLIRDMQSSTRFPSKIRIFH